MEIREQEDFISSSSKVTSSGNLSYRGTNVVGVRVHSVNADENKTVLIWRLESPSIGLHTRP
jgi:hypothetical protein